MTDVLDVDPAIADRVAMEERIGNITSVGPQNQRSGRDRLSALQPPYLPLSSRQDVLVFQTEPLAEPVEVTGPLTAVLWVSSDAPDTDITVKLVDVYPPNPDYPDGYDMNVSDSILRLRYRNSRERAELMAAGRGLSRRDPDVWHQQRLQHRTSHPAGYLQQQFPAFRRQPEHR